MARRGRPPEPRAASAKVINIKMRLYPGEDDDLVAFFEGIVPRLRAAMVKRALRSGVVGDAAVSEHSDELLNALDSFVR